MSNRLLIGTEENCTRRIACFFCSTTEIAYGPIFRGDGFDGPAEEAEAFEKWLETYPPSRVVRGEKAKRLGLLVAGDPRAYVIDDLMDLYSRFRTEVEAERKGTRV